MEQEPKPESRCLDSEANSGEQLDVGSSLRRLERDLQQIPSLFARLVFLSRAPGPLVRSSRPVPRRMIQVLQCKLFREWLRLDLREQAADLEPYLATLGQEPGSIRIRHLILRLCRDIVPAEACRAEVRLFLGTVEVVLEYLSGRNT